MITPQKSGCVLVTSGPTRAWLDRVRYIANTSTGALGARIVEALVEKGIPVKHLYGLGSELPRVSDPSLLEPVQIITIEDLIAEIKKTAAQNRLEAVVHAMAVLDYIPETRCDAKRASDTDSWEVRLVRTPKITALIRELLPDAHTVGFKLETGISEAELIRRAFASLQKHRLDLVVANDLDRVGTEAHEALFIGPDGAVLDRAATKREIAEKLAEFILQARFRNLFH
ncbi:MAG: phosphopantothenoylcysteine decarboxylase domain-containing protein [Candidatus Latescibacterota bacterium]